MRMRIRILSRRISEKSCRKQRQIVIIITDRRDENEKVYR